ncbi:SRPBCC family protein [Jejuia spongiicola]|uniref:SRPBCC domain-containing protein n=1 Tax=Jejuia spongiicola TaxID=2942207 RepID=A0ABT0QA69_9FLAO|nr:SRPBCC domain-containing protein [Jejuia spongiicola]MCL6293880.1 SRPBCC domain-containing protein [Jejuia spongiicola]
MIDSRTNYSHQIEFSSSPKQVFYALNDGIHNWWGKTSNSQFKTGGQFTITFENEYWWTFKILEYTPNKELVWKCIGGEPNFNKEWVGHVLHWQIEEKETKTILNFNQIGLTPELHCFEVCSSTWDMFITQKLRAFLT